MSQQQIKSKIIEYYRNILCREPDKDGLDLYLKMANSGTSLEKIRELFLESDEYSFLKSTKFLKHAPSFKTSFSDDEVKKMLDSVDGWYHYFKIGNTENTNTITSLNYQMWISQIIPTDLSGKTVLDIGANDGFYSFLCESRGAERIFAMDTNNRELNDACLEKFKEFIGKRGGEERTLGNDVVGQPIFKNVGSTERFQILKKILNSKVDYELMSVYDLDSIKETFDIGLFFGVYYHLENPVLALQKIFPKINDSLFLSGHIVETGEPKMYENLSYWNNWSFLPHLVSSDHPREQSPRWIASSDYLLRIGEKIGFKKCVLLDTLDMKSDVRHTFVTGKEYDETIETQGVGKDKDTQDEFIEIKRESKVGLFKFSK